MKLIYLTVQKVPKPLWTVFDTDTGESQYAENIRMGGPCWTQFDEKLNKYVICTEGTVTVEV